MNSLFRDLNLMPEAQAYLAEIEKNLKSVIMALVTSLILGPLTSTAATRSRN